MDGYTYSFNLSDGRAITINSFDPLSPDELRELKKKYEDKREGKGSIFRAPEHLLRRAYGGYQKAAIDAATYIAEDDPLNKLVRKLNPVPEIMLEKVFGITPEQRKANVQLLRESAAETEQEQRRKAAEAYTPEGETARKGMQLLGDVYGAAGGLVPMIAGSVATRNPTLAPAYLATMQQGGAKHHEYLQKNLAELRQANPQADEMTLRNIAHGEVYGDSLVQGLKTGAITAVGGAVAGKLGGLSPEAAGGLASKAGQEVLKKGYGRVLAASAGTEFAEEFADSLAEQAIELSTYYPDRKWFSTENETGILRQAAYEGAIGAILGGGLGAAGHKVQRNQAEEVEAGVKAIEAAEKAKELKRRQDILDANEEAVSDITENLILKTSEKVQNYLRREGKTEEAAQLDAELAEIKIKQAKEGETAKGKEIAALTEALEGLTKESEKGKGDTQLERALTQEAMGQTAEQIMKVDERPALPPEIDRALKTLGVNTIEEAYAKLTRPPQELGKAGLETVSTPAPRPMQQGVLPRQQEAGIKPLRHGGPVEVQPQDIEGVGPHPSGIPAGPKEMDADVLSQTGPPPTPLRTTNQIFFQKTPEETGPSFTGPSAIAAKSPDVLAPEPTSKEAGLGFLTGPRKLTLQEKALLRKKKRGGLLTSEEAGQVQGLARNARSYLEGRLYRKKKEYANKYGEGVEQRTSGITDQQAIEAGIKAGIDGLIALENMADVMDVAIYNAKKNSKHARRLSSENPEELLYSSIDRLAGRGAEIKILEGINRWVSKNENKKLSSDKVKKADERIFGIKELGETDGYTSDLNNFSYFDTGRIYGERDPDHSLKRFKHWLSKFDKVSPEKTNISAGSGSDITGDLSGIVNDSLEVQISEAGGSWITKRYADALKDTKSSEGTSILHLDFISAVEGSNPRGVIKALKDIIKAADESDAVLVGQPDSFSGVRSLPQRKLEELYRKLGGVLVNNKELGKLELGEESVWRDHEKAVGYRLPEKLSKSTIDALKKIRQPVINYIKNNSSRLSALAPDIMLAHLVDKSLSISIRLLSSGQSIRKSIDAAWDALGSEKDGYSKDKFTTAMMPRLLTAVNQMVAGSSPTAAINAATVTDKDDPVSLVKEQMIQRDKDIINNVELEDLSEKRRIRNFNDWISNTTIGRQDSTLKYFGLTQLGDRFDFQMHQQDMLEGKLMSMVLESEGGYKSAANWMQKWTTIKNEKLIEVEKEINDYRARLYDYTNWKKLGLEERPPKPDINQLSEQAAIIVNGMQKAHKFMGDYARDYGTYQINSEGKSVLGKFSEGEEGVHQAMKPEYSRVLNSIGENSLSGKSLTKREKAIVEELINEVGKVNKQVKDIKTLIHWRDGNTLSGEINSVASINRSKRGAIVTDAARNSNMEKTKENPLPSTLIDTSLDGFLVYISNWSKRMAEIQAYGQTIDPANGGTDQYGRVSGEGKDLFDRTYDIVESNTSIEKKQRDRVLEAIMQAKESAYRMRPRGPWSAAGATLEAGASLTMLSGFSNAIRNTTGALQVVGHSYYAGNTKASAKALLHLISFGKLYDLYFSGIDASQLKSWGVLRNDMSQLMAGYSPEESLIQGALLRAENIQPMARRLQTGVLSTFGFKKTEELVRTYSALTAHAIAQDAVEADLNGTNPELVNEFKDLIANMHNSHLFTFDQLKAGDKEAYKNFISRWVTTNQGGYTPNQLPYWATTPMGRFMGKFMPYGIQMNQLHADQLQRRRKLARRNGVPLIGGGFIPPSEVPKTKGNFTTIADLAILAGGFSLGGEMFAWLMELLFGKSRDVASLKEIMSVPADEGLRLALDRVYNNLLYVGTLGAVFETAEGLKGILPNQGRRTKDLTEPAPIAVINNFVEVIQDAKASSNFDALKMINDFLTKQVSIYRDAKYLSFKTSEAAGMEWQSAIVDKRKRQKRTLNNIARRYAEMEGLDSNYGVQGGRFLPTEMTPFYNEIKDSLYAGDVNGAKEAAIAAAGEMANKDRAWANISSSLRQSQPMKIGDYTATEYQEDFMRWAKRNIDPKDFKDIMEVHSVYIKTAEKAGLLGTGNPQVVREMKTKLTGKSPSRRRGTTTDPFQRKRNLLRQKAGF